MCHSASPSVPECHNVTKQYNTQCHNVTEQYIAQCHKTIQYTISQCHKTIQYTMSQCLPTDTYNIHNVYILCIGRKTSCVLHIVHNTTQCHDASQYRVSQHNTLCDRLGLTSDTHARRNTADSPESSVQIYISSIFGLDLRFPVPHSERLVMFVYQLLQSRIQAC